MYVLDREKKRQRKDIERMKTVRELPGQMAFGDKEK